MRHARRLGPGIAPPGVSAFLRPEGPIDQSPRQRPRQRPGNLMPRETRSPERAGQEKCGQSHTYCSSYSIQPHSAESSSSEGANPSRYFLLVRPFRATFLTPAITHPGLAQGFDQSALQASRARQPTETRRCSFSRECFDSFSRVFVPLWLSCFTVCDVAYDECLCLTPSSLLTGC